jgi:hypothetical protein
MVIHGIRFALRAAIFGGATVLLVTGCNKKDDNHLNFTNAINTYYGAHPACVWQETIRFPVQVDTSDSSKAAGYDALVDQGLLVRTTAEKKKLIIASKQVNNYDLSDQGRLAWAADVKQPGFGNFCYGHRKVDRIDGSTPTTSNAGATTQVNYHYSLADPPAWATATETQTAYPQIRADLSGIQPGLVTLTNTNNGWIVSSAPGEREATTNADGKIVE